MPLSTTALVIRKSIPAQKGAAVYHNVVLEQRPVPELKPGELLLKVAAVAFNRRDVRGELVRLPLCVLTMS